MAAEETTFAEPEQESSMMRIRKSSRIVGSSNSGKIVMNSGIVKRCPDSFGPAFVNRSQNFVRVKEAKDVIDPTDQVNSSKNHPSLSSGSSRKSIRVSDDSSYETIK